LTTDRGVHIYWWETRPAWSPDGTRLAYVSEGAVWVAPVEGGAVRRLHEGDSPIWVDDETLLITVERDEETRLAVMGVNDPWPRAITPRGHDVFSPRLVPGVDAAVYVRTPVDDRVASEIWWAGFDGATRKLTGVAGMHDLGPAVSPDGSTLVFSSEREGRYHLYALDLGIGEERRLTTEDAACWAAMSGVGS
jgi:Tol biopolymer transport system component